MENEFKLINKILNILVVIPLNKKFEEWGYPIRILSLTSVSKDLYGISSNYVKLYQINLDMLNPIRDGYAVYLLISRLIIIHMNYVISGYFAVSINVSDNGEYFDQLTNSTFGVPNITTERTFNFIRNELQNEFVKG